MATPGDQCACAPRAPSRGSMPAKASRCHRFGLRIRAALNCARLGDPGPSRSEQARTSAPQSGHTAGSGSRTSTANCVRHPRHAPATVCRRSGKTAGRCAPSKRNRVTSPPHNETMGYRPAVEAIQQRRCTARDRPALQTETGAEAFKGTLSTRGGTSLPDEEYHAETRVPPIPGCTGIRTNRPDAAAERATRNHVKLDRQQAADHPAARLHGSHSHGDAQLDAASTVKHWAGAPPHAHEFDEALIIRATVSLTPGISLATDIESLLAAEAPEARYRRGSQEHLAFAEMACRTDPARPNRVEPANRHGDGSNLACACGPTPEREWACDLSD